AGGRGGGPGGGGGPGAGRVAGGGGGAVASRAGGGGVGPPAGPAPLNLAFREPLVPTGAPLVEAGGRTDGRPWTAAIVPGRPPDRAALDALAALVRRTPRGVIVAGDGANGGAGTVLPVPPPARLPGPPPAGACR